MQWLQNSDFFIRAIWFANIKYSHPFRHLVSQLSNSEENFFHNKLSYLTVYLNSNHCLQFIEIHHSSVYAVDVQHQFLSVLFFFFACMKYMRISLRNGKTFLRRAMFLCAAHLIHAHRMNFVLKLVDWISHVNDVKSEICLTERIQRRYWREMLVNFASPNQLATRLCTEGTKLDFMAYLLLKIRYAVMRDWRLLL